jgi:HlyD family type I secretion membrane fusion protein
MAPKLDQWRQSIGNAIASATPVGTQLIDRLSEVIGGPQMATAPAPATPGTGAMSLDDWHAPLNQSIDRPVRLGMFVLIFFVGGFLVWSMTAPLASAVVARGVFVATGQNRIVQHLEGGIIKEIKAAEGAVVEAGEPLYILDDTSSKADVRRLEIVQATHIATKARIDAERTFAPSVTFPDSLLNAAGDEEIAKIMQSQSALFASRMQEFATQKQINESQIAAIGQELEGLKAQRESAIEQLSLVRQELVGAQKLFGKGLTDLPRLLLLKRNKSKLEGDVGQYTSAIGKAEERVLETRTELLQMRSKIIEQGADLYRQTTAELSDTDERLEAARAILNRRVIRAPVRGVVVKSMYHTTGGVIGPGQAVAELLPTDEKLLVEAAINPIDINHVHIGLEAELRLSALNQRTTPLVLGRVIYISADKIESDQRTQPGQFHYVARIELDEKTLKERVPANTKIAPGMPADVYVKTGDHTMMEYILKPIMDSMRRAGRES